MSITIIINNNFIKLNPGLKSIIIDNLLGDLKFTYSVSNLNYINHLYNNIYKDICGNTLPTPWPNNPYKKPRQY
jgi:hypothetical protein